MIRFHQAAHTKVADSSTQEALAVHAVESAMLVEFLWLQKMTKIRGRPRFKVWHTPSLPDNTRETMAGNSNSMTMQSILPRPLRTDFKGTPWQNQNQKKTESSQPCLSASRLWKSTYGVLAGGSVAGSQQGKKGVALQ